MIIPQQNQYSYSQEEIRNISLLKKFITQNLPHNLNPEKFQKELNDEIGKNYNKYKKQTLLKQRISLSLQEKYKIQQLNKKRIKQFIQQKISEGTKKKQKILKHQSEKKHLQRLIKQSINKNRREFLENQKIQKTLKTIQNLQKKQKSVKLPLRLRIIEAQTTSSTNPQKLKELKILQKYMNGRKERTQRTQSQVSSYSLQSRIKNVPQIEEESNTMLITALKQNQQIRGKSSSKSILSSSSLVPETIIQKSFSKKSKSMSNLNLQPLHLKSKQSSQKGELLKKVIEQRNDDLYNKYLQKKTIAYRAKSLSYHQDIKQIIQKYLKKHIKKID